MYFHKAKVLLGVIVSFLSVNLSAATVVPNPNGTGNIIFQPTNQDIDILNIGDFGVDWSYTLYMFDDTADISQFDPASPDFVNDSSVLALDSLPTQVNFSELVATDQITGDSLSLSGNDYFMFALWNHDYLGGSWVEASYAQMFNAAIPDIFNIIFEFDNPNNGINQVIAFAVDVVPVPVPAALLLFISGLLALVGFKLKFSRSAC